MSIGCHSVREPSRCASLSCRSSERSRQQRRQAVVDRRRPNKANPGIVHGRAKGGSVRSRRARRAGARPGRSAAAELATTSNGIYQVTSPGGPPALITGSPTGLRRLVVAASDAVYGAAPIESSQSGLWSNQSGSWRRLSSNQFVSDVAIDPDDASRITYVTNDNPYHDTSFATGVWISCNGGQTFTQYNAGLPMLRALSVAFDPRIPGRLIIGTNGRGYWQTQLPNCS
jgi:hypothetical protein